MDTDIEGELSLTKTLALTFGSSYTEQHDKTQNNIITLKNNIIRH